MQTKHGQKKVEVGGTSCGVSPLSGGCCLIPAEDPALELSVSFLHIIASSGLDVLFYQVRRKLMSVGS